MLKPSFKPLCSLALFLPSLLPWHSGLVLKFRVRKIPWKREWLPTPVFLPGESHEQKSLVGYSPCDRKELDTTERLTQGQVYMQGDQKVFAVFNF